jgi:hypothetical protein
MESQIEIVERLIEEGESFTFQNFCLDVGDSQGYYGGPDPPEWGIFKVRAQNIVSKHLSVKWHS